MKSSPQWEALRKKAIEYYHGCVFCGKRKEPLNLHHRYYIEGRLIDDYEPHEVSVFCKNCHDKLHAAFWDDLKERKKQQR